jgi:hypothetical protein
LTEVKANELLVLIIGHPLKRCNKSGASRVTVNIKSTFIFFCLVFWKQMHSIIASVLLGFIPACLYVYFMYGSCLKVGSNPRLQPSFKLSQHIEMISGRIFICKFHMHHWMFFSILLVPAIITCNVPLVSWCIVLICQGMCYSDRFDFYTTHKN